VFYSLYFDVLTSSEGAGYMKKCILVIILIISPIITSAETIRLTNGEWPPYLSENLYKFGYWSHIATEAFAIEGVKVEYTFYPWRRAFRNVAKGDFDGSIFWTKSPERIKDVEYSKTPVDSLREVFFFRKNISFNWKTIKDLEPYELGATFGNSHIQKFEKAIGEGIKLKFQPVQSEIQNINKLLRSRIDAFLCMESVCGKMLLQQYSQKERDLIAVHPKIWVDNPHYLIISKKNKRAGYWFQTFESGLQKLKESGRLQRIRDDFMNGKYDK